MYSGIILDYGRPGIKKMNESIATERRRHAGLCGRFATVCAAVRLYNSTAHLRVGLYTGLAKSRCVQNHTTVCPSKGSRTY